MSTESGTPLPLPGLDVVGRGIILRPREPYELKKLLFPQASHNNYFNVDTNSHYQLPEGYAVNESPPMPAGMALNQLVIEESIERLDKKLNNDAEVSCGVGPFSLDANASQTAQVQRDSSAYYVSRISFVPFLTVYVSDACLLPEGLFDLDIPVPFKHEDRGVYDKFFQKFGSHYVTRAWVGGKATLTLSVLKSSDINEEDIRAGIKASYTGLGSAGGNTGLHKKKESLLNNSECTVSGKGGDSLKLAALCSLDEVHYNEWMQTVSDNPQVVELGVVGIWTLLDDPEKAAALQAAYKEATTFISISAVFCIDCDIYLIRNRSYFSYNVETGETKKPAPICDRWPGLKDLGFDLIDATLSGNYNNHQEPTRLDDKVFFFCGEYYSEMDANTGEFSPAKKIIEGWPGVGFEKIDAALRFQHDTVYFFSGNQYVRYNVLENKADEGYPQLISERWLGVSFEKIDAAIYWGHGKVFFFRDDQYIRYDIVNYRADSGFPRHIKGNYVDDWNLFV